ncbi:MAG: Sigma-54 dependent transcriptional regulator [Ignavibacteriae bacterium]|nr:MAG: Sigma-54 dependent transcriptional regulator [Ignavibacteriota bacterium]
MGIVLVGEQGVEKDWIAKLIHDLSSRRNNKFIFLDCQNVHPDNLIRILFGEEKISNNSIEKHPGLLETASGGTIFLDNFSIIPSEFQDRISLAFKTKMVRRIGGYEDILINVRPITGIYTKDGVYLYQANDFQRIYSKFCPISINIPPLRERKEDILFLLNKFFKESNLAAVKKIKGFSKKIYKVLNNYHWPGNTKQLFEVVNYAIMMCDTDLISIEHLPGYIQTFNESTQFKNVLT